MVGTSPPTGLGSEPARCLDTPSFSAEPDRPAMVSLSSRAGTEEEEEEGVTCSKEKGLGSCKGTYEFL